jgi:ABC-type sugar transport system ATPase subunit
MKSIKVHEVSKSFAGNQALKNVSMELKSGEIHCLVGENGAGKSTIIKILAGQYQPDVGHLLLDESLIHLGNPRDARNHGIAVIHQELQLIPDMTIAENISLGQWPLHKTGMIDKGAMIERAGKVMKQLGLEMDPHLKISSLSTGQQQLVEIARALSFEAKVMILDEPTASLAQSEAEYLIKTVRRLRDDGVAILYVSHRLEEVYEIADTISVFRDGENVGTIPRADIVPDQIVHLMVGKSVSLNRPERRQKGEPVLQVRQLTRNDVLRQISFDLHKGEILGLGGLIGSGRTEVLRCLFGLDPIHHGDIVLNGKKITIRNPYEAIHQGIGLVPEDRKLQGLMLGLSVSKNTGIAVWKSQLSRWGFIRKDKEIALAETYQKDLNIKTQSINTPILSLSGGNQQKVLLARWIAIHPQILLLDEPTRGVDIGARAEIQEVIEKLVNQGVSVLLVSSDIEELLQLSDRIMVMRNGKMVAELAGESMNKEVIMQHATGSIDHERRKDA